MLASGADRLQKVRSNASEAKPYKPPRPTVSRLTTWRAHVWTSFHGWKKSDVEHPWARRYEIFSAVLLLAIVCVDVIVSVKSWPLFTSHRNNLQVFENLVILVFTLEYVLRLWSCVEDDKFRPRGGLMGRLQFSVGVLPLLDFAVLVVFYIDVLVSHAVRGLTAFRLVRVLRVVAVLKIERQIESFGLIYKVLKMKHAELSATLFLAGVLLLMCSCAMYYIENPIQPESFSSIPATMWWAVTALTTVGYGDIYPITPVGKFTASCVAFFGVGLFALPAGILSSGFVEVVEEKRDVECDELADMIDEDSSHIEELRKETRHLSARVVEVQKEMREDRAVNQAMRKDVQNILQNLLRHRDKSDCCSTW